jgi:hypothetical protein
MREPSCSRSQSSVLRRHNCAHHHHHHHHHGYDYNIINDDL